MRILSMFWPTGPPQYNVEQDYDPFRELHCWSSKKWQFLYTLQSQ
jgi:hypothetical protein